MVYHITKILEPAANANVGIEEQGGDRESRIATINYESKVADRDCQPENHHEDVGDDQSEKKLPIDRRNPDAEQLVAAVDRNHQLTAPHTVRNQIREQEGKINIFLRKLTFWIQNYENAF